MSVLEVKVVDGGVRFAVRVQPRASGNGIAGIHGSALKVRLHAPPVDGAANEALVEFFAAELGIAKRDVSIISGHSSRGKIVQLDGVSAERVRALAAGSGGR